MIKVLKPATNLYTSKQNSIRFFRNQSMSLDVFIAGECTTQNVSTASPSHSLAKKTSELLTVKKRLVLRRSP